MPNTKKKGARSGGVDESRERTGTRAKTLAPRVLVVDDVGDNRELYAEYLSFKGFEVVMAADGEEALRLASTMTFDVFVMDLALPVLDGWEATRRLKADERTRRIPIIALTGHVEPRHRQRALEAGCDCYLTKPHLPEDLHAEIVRVLERSR